MLPQSFVYLEQFYQQMDILLPSRYDELLANNIANIKENLKKFDESTHIVEIVSADIKAGSAIAYGIPKIMICTIMKDENKRYDALDYLRKEFQVFLKEYTFPKKILDEYENFDEYLASGQNSRPPKLHFGLVNTIPVIEHAICMATGFIVRHICLDDTGIDIDDLHKIKEKFVDPYERQYSEIINVQL